MTAVAPSGTPRPRRSYWRVIAAVVLLAAGASLAFFYWNVCC